jgi:hypothetical protein
MMTESSYRETAKIYAFPARGRVAAGTRRDEAKSTAERAPRVLATDFGSGWYHEAAVKDSEPGRKP